MTTRTCRRTWLTTLFGIGSLLLAADSCAASPLPGGQPLRDRVAGYEMTVLIDGVPAATYEYGGGTYVLGQLGSRYTLRVANHSGRRVEAVVSVDGRDVIDGRPADFRGKRGYLIPAWGSVDIDGWRISHSEAAAFRFSSVPESYAARMGNPREVGVIGVAVFPERYVPPPPVYYPRRPYELPDSSRSRDESSRGGDFYDKAAPPPASPHASAEPKGAGALGRSASGAPMDAETAQAAPAKKSRPGLGHRIRRSGELAHLRGRVRPRQRRPPGRVPRRALQRSPGPPGHGNPGRRPADLRGRRRPAQQRRPLPRQRRPLRGAPARMAALLRLALGAARMPSRWTATPRTNSCWRLTEVVTCARSKNSSPATKADLELPPPLRARRRSGGGFVAGGVLAGRAGRAGVRAGLERRVEVLDLALHHRAQPLHRPRTPHRRRGSSPSIDGPTDADAETATLHERIAAPGPSTDAVVAGHEAARRIDRAVAELPDDQREVFLMREVMELPFAEIASMVGVSEPTVKSRMRYALEKLRVALANLGDTRAGTAESTGSG